MSLFLIGNFFSLMRLKQTSQESFSESAANTAPGAANSAIDETLMEAKKLLEAKHAKVVAIEKATPAIMRPHAKKAVEGWVMPFAVRFAACIGSVHVS